MNSDSATHPAGDTDKTLKTTTDVNIDAVLDPAGYFNSLEALETRVIRSCKVRRLYSESNESQTESRIHVYESPNVIPKQHERDLSEVPSEFERLHHQCTRLEMFFSIGKVRVELCGIAAAIKMMQTEGFCDTAINAFIEVDDDDEDVIEAVDIPCDLVQRLAHEALTGTAIHRPDSKLADLVITVLSKFRPIVHTGHSDTSAIQEVLRKLIKGRPIGTSDQISSLQHYLSLASGFLALTVMSYAGSHCEQFAGTDDGRPTDLILFEQQMPGFTHYSFKKRKLACLDQYLKKEVWCFGRRKHTSGRASVLMTVTQFASLWGPVFAIPSTADFSQLHALSIQGGHIYRSEKPDRLESIQARYGSNVIPMHYMNTGIVHQSLEKVNSPLRRWIVQALNGNKLPETLIPFPSDSRMLIGYDSVAHASVVVKQQVDGELKITDDLRVKIPESPVIHSLDDRTALRVNEDCCRGFKEMGEAYCSHFRPLGTHDGYYLPDSYQINFGGGQWVNAGLQKQWKRVPASTYKSIILDLCSKPPAQKHIRAILDRKVGLEMSICTANSRRVTLWDALQMAFPGDISTLDEAYACSDAETLTPYLVSLSQSGLDQKQNLRLYWPPSSEAIPRVLKLKAGTLPTWAVLLEDTPISACFAVASSHCLEFHGCDTAHSPSRTLNRSCVPASNLLNCKEMTPVLMTTINLQQDETENLPLKEGVAIWLTCGLIEIRNCDKDAQLAFSDLFFLERPLRYIKSVRGKSGRPESFHPSEASKCTLPLAIMDRPRKTSKCISPLDIVGPPMIGLPIFDRPLFGRPREG